MGLPRIGFIGLGVMGSPMASHLVHAGYPLCVFDISLQAAKKFKQMHPTVCVADLPSSLAAHADIVVTMLPDGHVVDQVVFGDAGLTSALSEGALLLDTSSAEPWLTRARASRLAPMGITCVDAPVSGAQWGAEAADLVFMVGGEPADIDRVRPLLQCMGRSVHHVGPLGAGHTMKCINNAITAASFVATCEGLALGAQAGLDPAAMTAVLNESTGGSWISANHIAQRVLSRRFDDPFRLALMAKDIGIASALAAEHDAPTPLTALTGEIFRAAKRSAADDTGGASVSELARYIEQQIGAEIAPRDQASRSRKRR